MLRQIGRVFTQPLSLAEARIKAAEFRIGARDGRDFAAAERPTRTRILQKSEVRSLSTNTLVALTGNGLSMAEDLARRFVTTELNSKSENPEARVFCPLCPLC